MPSEGVVYHYTDAQALLQIIKTGRLRATSIALLNDTTELRFGLDVFRGVARQVLKQPEFATANGRWVVDDAESVMSATVLVFVTCFSRACDQLSQWRAYASPGYSIGFDESALLQLGVEPVNVIYDGNEQQDFMRRSIEADIRSTTGGRWTSSPTGKARGIQAQRKAVELMCRCKHEAFAEEKEVRLVTLRQPISEIHGRQAWRTPYAVDVPPGQKDLCWRADSRGVLIPFVELFTRQPDRDDPGPLPITDIGVGPNAHPAEAKQSLRELLGQSGYGRVNVWTSGVPLRP